MDFKKPQGRIVKMPGLPEIVRSPGGSARIIDATIKPAPRPPQRSSLFAQSSSHSQTTFPSLQPSYRPPFNQHLSTIRTDKIPSYSSKRPSPEAMPRATFTKPTVAPSPRVGKDEINRLRSTQEAVAAIEKKISDLANGVMNRRHTVTAEQTASRSSTPTIATQRITTPQGSTTRRRAASASPNHMTQNPPCSEHCLIEGVKRLDDKLHVISEQLESFKIYLEQSVASQANQHLTQSYNSTTQHSSRNSHASQHSTHHNSHEEHIQEDEPHPHLLPHQSEFTSHHNRVSSSRPPQSLNQLTARQQNNNCQTNKNHCYYYKPANHHRHPSPVSDSPGYNLHRLRNLPSMQKNYNFAQNTHTETNSHNAYRSVTPTNYKPRQTSHEDVLADVSIDSREYLNRNNILSLSHY